MQANIQRIYTHHLAFAEKMKAHPRVKTTRVLGVIFALEIAREGVESYYGNFRNRLYQFFIQNGVILRPVGNIVYILPPYIMTDAQLEKVYEVVEAAVEID